MRTRYYILALAFLVVCGAAIGLYLYTKPSPKAANLKADFIIKSDVLTSAFQANPVNAAKEYSDKVISVTGKLADVKTDDKGLVTLILEGSPGTTVSCILDKSLPKKLNSGDMVSIKGFCSGWDDLFSEVKLHSGSLVK